VIFDRSATQTVTLLVTANQRKNVRKEPNGGLHRGGRLKVAHAVQYLPLEEVIASIVVLRIRFNPFSGSFNYRQRKFAIRNKSLSLERLSGALSAQ
jgi:hypothetical protein